jgi:two-component system chemotaxis response regulator CheY
MRKRDTGISKAHARRVLVGLVRGGEMRALAIDDSSLIRRLVGATLTGFGFEVCTAVNGEEALVSLLRDGPFDLVVLDWNMPVMDGYEFLTRMRKLDRFAGVRVIMLTARNEMDAVRRALEAGANEYLMKPFSPELLQQKIEMVGLEIPAAMES